ncbi:hypothetical protein K469DRAFT_687818 [Zopfia rhizophila CBS 207.26]|uniref:Uncharacterized protein n=1 Tax=Zopfia rhizophila CBS 207.26 TaxID=1314779 RepID=A0A6A6E106_9PEZI|nr:hypothetical protein K469DRAFT_687818 [Zopfia rhizophila CBS 207.26]
MPTSIEEWQRGIASWSPEGRAAKEKTVSTPYLYPSSDGPRYTMAWSVNLALTVVTLVSSLVLSLCWKRENRKMDQRDAQVFAVEEGCKGKMEVSAVEMTAGNAAERRRSANDRMATYDT